MDHLDAVPVQVLGNHVAHQGADGFHLGAQPFEHGGAVEFEAQGIVPAAGVDAQGRLTQCLGRNSPGGHGCASERRFALHHGDALAVVRGDRRSLLACGRSHDDQVKTARASCDHPFRLNRARVTLGRRAEGSDVSYGWRVGIAPFRRPDHCSRLPAWR